jgi:FkbM family methyltransferase
MHNSVRYFLHKAFRKIAFLLTKFAYRLYTPKPTHEETWAKYNQHSGDLVHRLTYNLNAQSIVMDVGGFEGQWASDIYAMYHATVYVFEPIEAFYNKIQKRFTHNPHIKAFHYGLSDKNDQPELSVEDLASSAYKRADNMESVVVRDILIVMDELGLQHIDLIKLNIEGEEYPLLEYLIRTGNITRFKNIQVQFHNFMENAQTRMDAIHQELAKTHRITYQYEFVWESWERIN